MLGGILMRINRERFVAALVRLDITGNQLAEKAGGLPWHCNCRKDGEKLFSTDGGKISVNSRSRYH